MFKFLNSKENNSSNDLLEKSDFYEELINLKENNSYSFQQIIKFDVKIWLTQVGKGSHTTSLQIMYN